MKLHLPARFVSYNILGILMKTLESNNLETSGAARGCGWQKICSFINLGAYYVVGIPSAILFAFVLHAGGQVIFVFFVNLFYVF